MRYRVKIDGGWREVELVPWTLDGPLVTVRDVHRGTFHRVLCSDCSCVVPRSKWEEE